MSDILEKLTDNASTTVDIPEYNEEILRCKGLLIKKESPNLELLFPRNSWDPDKLIVGVNCSMAVEHEQGLTINFIAKLETIISDRRLHFIAREPVAPESLRDYFRVAINTPIEASYIAGPKEIKVHSWKMIGTTIDMSGSGLLAMFAEKPPSQFHIQLVIGNADIEEPIVCLANVVRSYRIRKNRYQVAFHFENITTKTRDMIISICLREQRRQLRENVHII